MKLPQFIASTSVRETGLVRAQDIGALTNVGDAEFRALSQVGAAIGSAADKATRAYLQRQIIDDDIEAGDVNLKDLEIIKRGLGTARNYVPSVDEVLPDDVDYLKKTTAAIFSNEVKAKVRADILSDYERDSAKLYSNIVSPRIKARLIAQRNLRLPDYIEAIDKELNRTHEKYQIKKITDYANTAAANGDIDLAMHWIDRGIKHKLFDDAVGASLKVTYAEIAKRSIVNSIKPLLIDGINTGGREGGYEVLGEAVKRIVDEGLLTKAEAADADKMLGDWIDNYVAGRFKRAEDAEKLTTRQTYIELSEAIIGGALTFDGIDESALLKADKDKWKEFIRGSYQDAPTENTPKGHDTSFNAVYDAATLQLSPTEAYDVLLEARFTERTITDEQFKWAVDKIENPYPEHLLEDINAATKSNLEDFNRFWALDNERNMKVNQSLLAWIDKLIEQDEVPLFDFKKKMYAMSSQFRTGNARWYDIGQIIQRGGRNWEVVGFDEDGEPLVEEVK